MEETITLAKANQIADEYIKQAKASLPTESRLKLRQRFESYPCSDPTDNGPQGRRIASHDYELIGFQRSEIANYFDRLRIWWIRHNFRILKDTPQKGYLWAENNRDAFRMTLKSSDSGRMFLIVSSPCVWPNGTPEPS